MAKEYELRFLPLFEEDLNEIVDYIKTHSHVTESDTEIGIR